MSQNLFTEIMENITFPFRKNKNDSNKSNVLLTEISQQNIFFDKMLFK